MNLTGKVAFVTGGSRGIGRAISKKLASLGANVFLTFNERQTEAEKVVREIKDLNGNAIFAKMNVCKRLEVSVAMEKCKDSFDGIDILVNNAGINMPTDFDKILDNDWDEIMATNLKGPFICSQLAIKFMKERRGGSIINIGSVSGQYGGPRTAHYAASKAGLISLSQVIARFGASENIRCNTISAGLIETEMAEKGLSSPIVKDAAKNIILKRFGTPNEIADVVAFLASDGSSYITAQTLNVNGGLYF